MTAIYEIEDQWLEGETFNGARLTSFSIQQIKTTMQASGLALVSEPVEVGVTPGLQAAQQNGNLIGRVKLNDYGQIVVYVDKPVLGIPALQVGGTIFVEGGVTVVRDIAWACYFMSFGDSGVRIVRRRNKGRA